MSVSRSLATIGRLRRSYAVIAILMVSAAVAPTGTGAWAAGNQSDQPLRRMEHLDRGLVAVTVETGVYLSWRFLGDEPDATTFRVYRDGARIAEVADSSNYSDPGGTADSTYAVAPVIEGVEGERSAALAPQSEQYFDIPLQRPPAAPAPLLETFPRTVTDKVFEPVDMQLLRDVREAYGNERGLRPSEFNVLIDRFRVHFGDPRWKPRTRFIDPEYMVRPGRFRISPPLFEELDAAFTRYVDELDRGPRLNWLRNPDGSIATQTATYTPGDATVGDLDGDGDYELVLKWNPSNQKDSSVYGSTSPAIVDAYTLEGTLLWRINVGYNIRAGAHDTQLVVADLDLDGRAELVIKTADGTTAGHLVDGQFVASDVIGRAGAAPDRIAEYIAAGDAPSLDEYYDGLNTYAVSWIIPGGSTPPEQNHRQWGKVYVHGVIGTSNEYLTAFDGVTGRVIDTVDYAFPYGEPNWGAAPVDHRGASFLNPVRDGGPGEPPQVPVPPEEIPDPYWVDEQTRWGFYPWGDHQGNRANRFIAGIAYLDGERPSAIMGRGYYARATVAAYTLEDGELVLGDTFDSETYPEPELYHHKGAQTITMSDVDLDGRDEIVFGALILEEDLTPRTVAGTWFPFPVPEVNINLTQQMHNPDADDRFSYLGHGDAFHVGDFNPGMAGTEVFLTSEIPADFNSIGPDGEKGFGYRPSASVYDPRTGDVLVGMYSAAGDLERGVAANIDPNQPGAEYWTNGFVWSAITGERLYANASGSAGLPHNFLLYWDGDLQREILDGNTISKANTDYDQVPEVVGDTNLLVAEGATGTNDGGRNSPIVSADLFGDWREEVVWRVGTDTLRVYTTTIPTEHGIRTLMHDPQYRLSVASEGSVYNQPPHPGFFLDEDIATYPLPAQRDDIDVSPVR
jgi:rhamnogalacturonan endolyase